MTECRPPDGTPDGTVCWLKHDCGEWMLAKWRDFHRMSCWQLFGRDDEDEPSWLAHEGWRFHSIAKPPEG